MNVQRFGQSCCVLKYSQQIKFDWLVKLEVPSYFNLLNKMQTHNLRLKREEISIFEHHWSLKNVLNNHWPARPLQKPCRESTGMDQKT